MMARLLAIFILLAAQNTWGQEAATQNSRPTTNLVTVTYPVADLVVPIYGLDTESIDDRTDKTKEEWLIQKITRTVSPSAWSDKGGAGTIQYYASGMALVVKQSPQVQAQVKKLITTFRNAQSIEVSMETRVLTVSSSFYRGIMAMAEKDLNLSEIQLFMLLEAAQGDSHADVLRAPKVTVFAGQRCRVSDGGQIEAKLCAMVAGNLQHVDVDVKASIGALKFEKTCRVLDGSTLVLASQKDATTHQLLLVTTHIIIDEEETAPPPPPLTLSGKTTPQANAAVTQAGAIGRDVVPLPPQTYPAPDKVVPTGENPRLAKILQKYDEACTAGDQAKARRLAVRALDIDPACFQKNSGK